MTFYVRSYIFKLTTFCLEILRVCMDDIRPYSGVSFFLYRICVFRRN